MNSRQSHAHLVLTTAYRSIYFKMRWMNELAERGLRPVWRTARRARQAARRSRSSSTAAPGGRRASRGRPRPAAASGLRRMEPLEMRLMLAAHDVPGSRPVTTHHHSLARMGRDRRHAVHRSCFPKRLSSFSPAG